MKVDTSSICCGNSTTILQLATIYLKKTILNKWRYQFSTKVVPALLLIGGGGMLSNSKGRRRSREVSMAHSVCGKNVRLFPKLLLYFRILSPKSKVLKTLFIYTSSRVLVKY